MKPQSVQSRFIDRLTAELDLAHKLLVEARQDIEFYRGKVERLELAIMSNPPAMQEYVQTQIVQKPVIQDVKAQAPPRIPFMDLKRKWMAMTAEEQEQAVKDGWEVDKPKEEANAGI